MKALIIGAAGFVGKYLVDELLCNNYKVYATKLSGESLNLSNCQVIDLDILFENNISDVLTETRPDVIFHLAAQSSVALSWKRPALTIDINIKGTVNLLEAVKKIDYKPKILLIGSGEEYGKVSEDDNPINESHEIHPSNIYAVSKVCMNMLGKVFADAYNLDVIMVRAFNHIGPGQSAEFVISDFCKQVAEIENGNIKPIIYVGNLNAKRDFTDVRDIVRAYRLLSVEGKRGEMYNVGNGRAVEINNILNIILSKSITDIKVEIDKEKFRPVDVPIIEADIKKIKKCIGWKPEIDLQITIEDTLEYWRNKIN